VDEDDRPSICPRSSVTMVPAALSAPEATDARKGWGEVIAAAAPFKVLSSASSKRPSIAPERAASLASLALGRATNRREPKPARRL
jgi:hypothetical protein